MRGHSTPALTVALGTITALVTQGCAQKPVEQPQPRTAYKIPSEPPEIPAGNPEAMPTKAEDVAAGTLKAKQDFQEALTENLRQLDEQLRELQLRVASLTEEAKAGWAEKLDDLQAKRKAAGEKLGEVRSATGEAWEHLREGSQAAWQELETALKKAAAEF